MPELNFIEIINQYTPILTLLGTVIPLVLLFYEIGRRSQVVNLGKKRLTHFLLTNLKFRKVLKIDEFEENEYNLSWLSQQAIFVSWIIAVPPMLYSLEYLKSFFVLGVILNSLSITPSLLFVVRVFFYNSTKAMKFYRVYRLLIFFVMTTGIMTSYLLFSPDLSKLALLTIYFILPIIIDLSIMSKSRKYLFQEHVKSQLEEQSKELLPITITFKDGNTISGKVKSLFLDDYLLVQHGKKETMLPWEEIKLITAAT